MKRRNKQIDGFSLVELLVGLAVGLIAISGALSIVITTLASSNTTLGATRLNEDLSAAMQVLVNDVRRAGYWGTTNDSIFDYDTPSMTRASANCLLYAYDEDADSTLDSTEYFGFRLSNGTVEMRTRGDSLTDCADSDNRWESLTDPDIITVTAFTFTDSSQCVDSKSVDAACGDPSASPNPFVKVRQLDITLTGVLAGDGAVTKTLQESVRLRNDEVL